MYVKTLSAYSRMIWMVFLCSMYTSSNALETKQRKGFIFLHLISSVAECSIYLTNFCNFNARENILNLHC